MKVAEDVLKLLPGFSPVLSGQEDKCFMSLTNGNLWVEGRR